MQSIDHFQKLASLEFCVSSDLFCSYWFKIRLDITEQLSSMNFSLKHDELPLLVAHEVSRR